MAGRGMRERFGRALDSLAARGFVGPVILIVSPEIPNPWKIGGLVLGTALTTGGALAAERHYRQAQELRRKDDGRRQVEILLHTAVTDFEAMRPSRDSEAKGERTLRANVMLLDKEGFLRVEYRSEGYQEEDRKVRWRRGQGCAGEALRAGRTLVAPEADELPVRPDDASKKSRPWNMSPEQVRATTDICAVISTPIRIKGTAVGVLNFDDSRPLTESPLGTGDVGSAVEQLAEYIGNLLDEFVLYEAPAR